MVEQVVGSGVVFLVNVVVDEFAQRLASKWAVGITLSAELVLRDRLLRTRLAHLLGSLRNTKLRLWLDLGNSEPKDSLIDANRLARQFFFLLDSPNLQKCPIHKRRFWIETVEEFARFDRGVKVFGHNVEFPLCAKSFLGERRWNRPRLLDDGIHSGQPLAHFFTRALHEAHRLEDASQLQIGRGFH